jgi:hypothetical protein
MSMETSFIPDEEQKGELAALIHQLNQASVVKRFECYRDIAWDAPENGIIATDPVWELTGDHVLGATAWYRAQPAETRARIGLSLIASSMRIGVQFENVLTRGLLGVALHEPNGSPLFRYLYHESIEESHHSLMFQEFLNRSGVDAEMLRGWRGVAGERIVKMATRFPELFFIFVLGGEDPIDHVQRTVLRSGRPLHPLIRRITQIHVTEEARHLAFARAYLRDRVPKLPPWKRKALSLVAPVVLQIMARAMLQPPRKVIRTFGIPAEVVREAYTDNPVHKRNLSESLTKVRTLMRELEID